MIPSRFGPAVYCIASVAMAANLLGAVQASAQTKQSAQPLTNSSTASRSYVVQPGDTFAKLAKRFSVSQSAIELANSSVAPTNMIIGTHLVIPSGKHVAMSARMTTSGTSTTLATGQAILASGETFIGTPYVWGGVTPHPGFDCSGFVHYVFAENGIQLPRTAHQQATVGTPVSKSNLQPGDLLFFANTDSYAADYANHVTHVGIYAGNGNMLESTSANNDQGVVIIHNVFGNSFYVNHYYGARRVIK